MISWSADYLENVLGMIKADAAQAVSLFFVGMILGRLAGSRLVQYFSTPRLVSGSILVASFGFVVFWKTGIVIGVLFGLFITGLGVGSLYPLFLSLAMGAAGSNVVKASARATLASGAAILTLPLVLEVFDQLCRRPNMHALTLALHPLHPAAPVLQALPDEYVLSRQGATRLLPLGRPFSDVWERDISSSTGARSAPPPSAA